MHLNQERNLHGPFRIVGALRNILQMHRSRAEPALQGRFRATAYPQLPSANSL